MHIMETSVLSSWHRTIFGQGRPLVVNKTGPAGPFLVSKNGPAGPFFHPKSVQQTVFNWTILFFSVTGHNYVHGSHPDCSVGQWVKWVNWCNPLSTLVPIQQASPCSASQKVEPAQSVCASTMQAFQLSGICYRPTNAPCNQISSIIQLGIICWYHKHASSHPSQAIKWKWKVSKLIIQLAVKNERYIYPQRLRYKLPTGS